MSESSKSSIRILVVRMDRLGDALLTTPMLAALRRNYIDAYITVLASHASTPALAKNTRIDELITVDLQKSRLPDRLRLAKELRNRKFDITICVSEKRRARIITWLAGSRMRIGFYPGWTQPIVSLFCHLGLTHAVRSEHLPNNVQTLHEVERLMLLLRPLGIDACSGPLEVSLSDDDSNWARDWLAARVPRDATPIAVNLNTKWLADGWRVQDIVLVLEQFLENIPAAFLIITSDESSAELAHSVYEQADSNRLCTLVGSSFDQWASITACCRVVVTTDTGTAHLAAALGIPVVDIFPSLDFEKCSKRWSPWCKKKRAIQRSPIPMGTSNRIQLIRQFGFDLAEAVLDIFPA